MCCGNIAACSRRSGLFFFAFQFSFVQNGSDLSKGCEGRKKFSNFLVFGGSKDTDSSLTGGGNIERSKGKEAVDAERKDDAFSLRSIFNMKGGDSPQFRM